VTPGAGQPLTNGKGLRWSAPHPVSRGCAGPAGRRCAHRGCLWRLARSASPRPVPRRSRTRQPSTR